MADTFTNEVWTYMGRRQTTQNKLAQAWKAGDSPAVERIVLQDLKDDPQMYQRLLVDRNRAWLPKIEALFARRGHSFIVVGAAHLVGPDGLLDVDQGRQDLILKGDIILNIRDRGRNIRSDEARRLIQECLDESNIPSDGRWTSRCKAKV